MINPLKKEAVGILTEQEREILGFVVRGISYDEIAKRFGLDIETAYIYLDNIFRKIDVSDRLQAMLWAGQNL